MPTSAGGLADDPLAKAVLRTLADRHGADEPLGSFARTVLSGQSGLREAASESWHGEGLSHALTSAIEEQARLTHEERAKISEAARRLRQAGPSGLERDTDRPAPSGGDW